MQNRVVLIKLLRCVVGLTFTALLPSIGDTQTPRLNSLHWSDITGKSYQSTDLRSNKSTVFIFTSTQCPISSIYTPRINKLVSTFNNRGVQFFIVNSNQEDSVETVRKFANDREIRCPVVKDKGTELADALSANSTPEAVVIDSDFIVRYRGRIDDNTEVEKVIRPYLHDALIAILAGKPILRSRTLAVGCAIFRDSGKVMEASQGSPTYAHDAAPIIFSHCVSCHRPGENGPFSLTTYQQAKTWASAIQQYTARKVMPPWKPVNDNDVFLDSHALSEKEIGILASWADSGAPLGDANSVPPLPTYAASTSWKMGKPDIIMQPKTAYHLSPEGKDVYRNYVFPQEFSQDQFVRAVEFKEDNRAIVHHIVVYIDRSGMAASLDNREKEPGYTVSGTGIGVGVEDTDWLTLWTPGSNSARIFPAGTAYKVPAGARMVLQVHYHKTGRIETDQSRAGIFFTPAASVKQEIKMEPILNAFFKLEPGKSDQEVTKSYHIQQNLHVWAVMPHMHMLGKRMKMEAVLPDGKQIPLITINDWDFNWQDLYRFKTPIALPKGSRIDVTALYDNTEQNPRQPSHPPRMVRWGEQSTDEMFIGFFQYTVDKPSIKK